jgi:hypothetical protein
MDMEFAWYAGLFRKGWKRKRERRNARRNESERSELAILQESTAADIDGIALLERPLQ